jgi:hypothetical protein
MTGVDVVLRVLFEVVVKVQSIRFDFVGDSSWNAELVSPVGGVLHREDSRLEPLFDGIQEIRS